MKKRFQGMILNYKNFAISKKDLLLFFIIIAMVSVAIGFSDGIFANYFREVYKVDGYGRGMIELPREMPGILSLLVISGLAFLGNIRIAIIAQALAATGLFVLGFFTPAYNYMLVFLFLTSLGFHLYMPLRDSIGMSLSEKDKIGKRMGQFAGMRFAFITISSIAVYFLFKFDVFSFESNVKWFFVIAACFYMLSLLLLIKLYKDVGKFAPKSKKFRIVFRKEYKFYYMLAVVFGVQKQVMIVFGPWVLIETLSQKVDTIILLGIIASFIGMFFMVQLGKWIDRFGVKKLLMVDALSFIGVYLCYGLLCMAFANGNLLTYGFPVIMTAALFVIDRLSAQMGVVRVVYLKSIILTEEDLTPTLSTGMGLDHVVSILVGVSGGILWVTLGSQYIFFIVAAISLINLFVAIKVKEPNPALQKK